VKKVFKAIPKPISTPPNLYSVQSLKIKKFFGKTPFCPIFPKSFLVPQKILKVPNSLHYKPIGIPVITMRM